MVEEALAVPMVVVTDLVVEVVKMAAEGSKKSSEKGYRSCRGESELSGKLQVTSRVIPNAFRGTVKSATEGMTIHSQKSYCSLNRNALLFRTAVLAAGPDKCSC